MKRLLLSLCIVLAASRAWAVDTQGTTITPLKTTLQSSQNIYSGVTLTTYTPTAAEVIRPQVDISSMNGAVTTVTVKLRDTSNSRTLYAISVPKDIGTDTGMSVLLPPFLTTANVAYAIQVSSTNSSDTGTVCVSNWLDAGGTYAAAPTAAAVATAVWQDATAGDLNVASSIGYSLYTGNHAPGAASGLALVGSNMGTITGALTAAQIATGVWQDATAADFTTASSIGKQMVGGLGALQTITPVNATSIGGQTASAAGTVTFPATIASTTNITAASGVALSAAGVTAIWQDATPADFTTASSIGHALYTGNYAPGAANGLSVVGSTMAVGNVTVGGYAANQGPLYLLTGGTNTLTVDSSHGAYVSCGTATGQLSATAGVVAASGNWNTTAPPSAATIATTVWQDLTASSDFTTTASIGKLLVTDVDAKISTAGGGASASAIATAVWQDTTPGDFTETGSIGKSLFTSGNAPGTAGGILTTANVGAKGGLPYLDSTNGTTLVGYGGANLTIYGLTRIAGSNTLNGAYLTSGDIKAGVQFNGITGTYTGSHH